MQDRSPAHSPLRRHEVVRIVALAGMFSFAAGFAVSDLNSDSLLSFARLGVGVAAIALLVLGYEIRMARRLARLEELVERAAYWKAYSDAFSDLSGADENTLDIRRP